MVGEDNDNGSEGNRPNAGSSENIRRRGRLVVSEGEERAMKRKMKVQPRLDR